MNISPTQWTLFTLVAITLRTYEAPNSRWDYDWLSMNPNITWEIVKANPDKPWDYPWMSHNPNITRQIVDDNPDKPWDYHVLARNPSVMWKSTQRETHPPYECMDHGVPDDEPPTYDSIW